MLKKGFTLIELSIVLVVIGLVVGGVLVGRDLIVAAKIRAQLSQVEQYSIAVRNFRLKYNALPGDISAQQVSAIGFTTLPVRVGTTAQGDGNGIFEGIYSGSVIRQLQHGETVWFWVDLTANSGMIAGNFNSATATPTVADVNWRLSTAPYLNRILPEAKIGQRNSVSIYSVGVDDHYFIVSAIDRVDSNGAQYNNATGLGISASQAYFIDNKIDDGLPQSGIVTPRYLDWGVASGPIWAAGTGVAGPSTTTATAASATSCYDNGNVGGGTQRYSLGFNSGDGMNCALMIKFR